MKPKDALIKDGFPGVKPGKGRLSQAAKDRLSELVRQGWKIDGYAVSATGPNKKTVTDTPVPVVKTVSTTEKVIADLFFRFPERDFKAFTLDDGVEVSMRSACGHCHNSLTAHICNEPSALVAGRDGFVPVRIVANK